MEKTLIMGAFEMLSNIEMMEIDGGRQEDYDAGKKIGAWARNVYDTVSDAVSNAWNWVKNLF